MMTPRVSDEDSEAELHFAILRLRKLLQAQKQQQSSTDSRRENNTKTERESSTSKLSPSPVLPSRAPRDCSSGGGGWVYMDSMRSVDLGDESSDKCLLLDERKKLIEDEEKEEKSMSIVAEALPLPPLHWNPPTLQQRLEAIEKQHERKCRRQKRVDGTARQSWFRNNPVSAAVAAKVVCGDITDVNDDFENKQKHQRAAALTSCPCSSSSCSSSLSALSEDRSEESSSQDTYAASHASTDDVYIHELAREYESPPNASTNIHLRWGSVSTTLEGTCGQFSMSPPRFDAAVIAAVVGPLSESTGVTAQMEFDRIGTGEEAPYTPYLFSPEARIVDLSAMTSSSSYAVNSPDGNKRAEEGNSHVVNNSFLDLKISKSIGSDTNKSGGGNKIGKDGCTRVCFSPVGDCYIVGTQRGKLWFVQVCTMKPGHYNSITTTITSSSTTTTTAANPLLLEGHSGNITDITFNDVGTCFASAGADVCIILWNQKTRSKIRRVNTDGGIPTAIRFMPKNNNYLLVSIPQHHLLCLYNSSTGLPVKRKMQVIRVEATALAMEPCTYPFLFLGDVHGNITAWRYHEGCEDAAVAYPSVVTEEKKKEVRQRLQPTPTTITTLLETAPSSQVSRRRRTRTGAGDRERGSSSSSSSKGAPSTMHKQPTVRHNNNKVENERKREYNTSSTAAAVVMVKGHPQFEKIATVVVEKGISVASLVVSSMNHQQFHCLLRAQRMSQEAPERNVIKKWAAAALGGGWQRHEQEHVVSNKTRDEFPVKSAYAVMLLASFPRDRLVILCVQPSKSTPREYKLLPMLVVNGACRVRQMSVGTSFCMDNMRSPTFSCTCEEGFVHIITCTPEHPSAFKQEKRAKNTTTTTSGGNSTAANPIQWSVMATLAVPCGGIPCSLAWSPDMRLLVAVTEEGMLYEWSRVHLEHGVIIHPFHYRRRSEGNDTRDDDDSITIPGGPRPGDEAEEWRVCLQRERERQMRRYRPGRDAGDSSDNSLSGMDAWWARSGDSMSHDESV